jgi:hypothetical protein
MHELTAGRVFVQPDSAVELSRQDTDRIATLGHVGRSVGQSEGLAQPERWKLLLEGAIALHLCSEAGKEQLPESLLCPASAIGNSLAVIRNLVEQVQVSWLTRSLPPR